MQQLMERKRALVFLVLSGLTVCFAYYPSLFVPFYLDDIDSIVNNPLLQATSIEPLVNSGYFPRIVSYLTIWANYQLNGLEPFGYHVVNILIHMINGVLVFFLAQIFLHYLQPATKKVDVQIGDEHRFWALLISVVWVLHPLNSQPVIYIVQRLTSLATLFMILTMICYIRAWRSESIKATLTYAAMTLALVTLGFFSKQNFVVVFVFLYMWTLLTEGSVVRRFLLRATAVVLIAFVFIAPFPFMADYWIALDQMTRDEGATSRLHYFFTQMLVLWDYIFRFLLPVQLQLEISTTLRESFEPIVALAALGHLLLISLAFKLRRKIPMFLVGVVLFYSSHTIESFIFPIKDLAFEHRTYFGNIGLVMAAIALLRHFTAKQSVDSTRWMYVVIPLCISLSVFSIFNRATQWQEPLTFYKRELRLSPLHPRVNAAYGEELAEIGNLLEAEKYLKKSIDIYLSKDTISAGVLNTYMTVLYQQKKFQQAAQVVLLGLKHVHYPIRRSALLSNVAVGYIYMGYCDFAIGLLEQALKLNPANKDADNNKNYCLQRMGKR